MTGPVVPTPADRDAAAFITAATNPDAFGAWMARALDGAVL